MIVEKIMEILRSLHPDCPYAEEMRLVDDGILDSLDIVTLVTELNDAFGVTIPAREILPDRFNSPQAILDMITHLQDI